MIDRYRMYLNARNLRASPTRLAIAAQAFANASWFSAEELQQTLKAQHITRPAVYRTLAELCEAMLLVKSGIGPACYHIQQA